MDINLVDITVHIDENLSPEQKITVGDSLLPWTELSAYMVQAKHRI
jgi:hypothetical protein